MGPRHLSRGIARRPQRIRRRDFRFNGATAFEPWNPASTCVAVRPSSRFNGATAFEPWNQLVSVYDGDTITMLQWGHGI